jgi:Uncharacterised protein family (UPF0236)
MAPAQIVGQVFFPLDEELALQPGSLTPRQQEHLGHLGSWMPFARAAQMLECLLGVQVSEATTRRQTEQAGALAQAAQTSQTQAKQEDLPAAPAPERLVVSADGAMVPLLQGEWAEVRTVAIGEVEQAEVTQDEDEGHVEQLSYFSRLSTAETFADLAEVEMRRRGVSQAERVCAVSDGADWLQGFVDLHRPDALRILDFPHAAEHVSLLIQAVQQAGIALPPDLLPRLLHRLKHRGPRLLVRLLVHMPDHLKQQEAVREHAGYLCKREALMQYQQYREQGWPIGSGMVESANKVVVEARLKGAGRHWERQHVNPMLTLRNAVCNERWSEVWQESLLERCHQRQVTRQHQATERYHQLVSTWMLLLLQVLPPMSQPAPPPARPKGPAATLPGSSRPSAYHPWKQSPACRPKLVAKH